MQLFVNYWSTALTVAATASSTSLSVPPALAAELVGLGSGDHYLLTIFERDPLTGAELRREIVRATAVSGGSVTVVRGQEDTDAQVWDAGALIEGRVTAGTLEALQSSGGGADLSDATPEALGVASPGISEEASRSDHVHPLPTPAAIGAASDTDLADGLAGKVDKVPGYGLSQENFTADEKTKLAGLESSRWKGVFANLAALEAAYPTAEAGDYADVDGGASVDVVRYIWDDSDSAWVAQASGGGSMTPAEVKAAYESNPDTNAFTDADETKLAGIETGAQANYAAVTQAEAEAGSSTVLKSWSPQRVWQAVRAVTLTGLDTGTAADVTASDSVLSAFGKLQARVAAILTSLSGKLTNPMTTVGDIITGGTSGAAQRLAVGSNGQVLKVVGGVPSWAAEAGSSTIVTQSVSSSAGTLDLSATTAPVILCTLTENITSIILPAGVANQSIERRIVFTQAAGNYTIPTTTAGWGGISVEGGGSIPQMGTGAGTVGVYVLANDNNTGWRMYLDRYFTGGTLTSALNEAPIVTLASAATVDIGAAAANTISISGTTTITSLGTIANGAKRRLVFQGALTLTHNATSLILPGGANITAAAGDTAEFVSLGSGNWRCVDYTRADGTALALQGRVVQTSGSQSIDGIKTFIGLRIQLQNTAPGFWLDESDGSLGAYAVLDGGVFQIQRRASGFGAFQATPVSVNMSAPSSSFAIASDGSLTASGVYSTTTANAANVNVASNGVLARSTSSEKYKNSIEPMELSYAEAVLDLQPIWYRSSCEGDNPDWSWWGFSAEQAAGIDPRLVHWKTHERVVEVFNDLIVDAEGNPVLDEGGAEQYRGREEVRMEPLAEPEPEGFAYERLTVHHHALLKQQQDRIAALEKQVASLLEMVQQP